MLALLQACCGCSDCWSPRHARQLALLEMLVGTGTGQAGMECCHPSNATMRTVQQAARAQARSAGHSLPPS